MPSPISHAAIVWIVAPIARPPGLNDRRRLAISVLLTALCLPDADFVIGLIFPDSAFGAHGGATHSFAFALGVAVVVGLFWRLACGRGASRMGLLSMVCGVSHGIMDSLTWGRGVMLFWPWTTARIASPLPLFVGLHRSQPDNWMLHTATLVSEGVFVGLVWLLARRLHRRGPPRRVGRDDRRRVEQA